MGHGGLLGLAAHMQEHFLPGKTAEFGFGCMWGPTPELKSHFCYLFIGEAW